MTSFEVLYRDLGRLEYAEADRLQREAHARVRASGGTRAEILAVEHPPVITLGIRGCETADLEQPLDSLRSDGWSVVKTDRGGQATLHEPGQIVIYPIVPLAKLGLGVREFVDLLLSASQKALRRHGVVSEIKLEPAGLYTRGKKIVFCGLRIEKGVSRHGISVNLWNDPRHFARIRACGVSSGAITNVENETGIRLSPTEFFSEWSEGFDAQLNTLLQARVREKPNPSVVGSWRSW